MINIQNQILTDSISVAEQRANPLLKTFADRLQKAGKPHKLIATEVARKLVTMANALCKSGKLWNQYTA